MTKRRGKHFVSMGSVVKVLWLLNLPGLSLCHYEQHSVSSLVSSEFQETPQPQGWVMDQPLHSFCGQRPPSAGPSSATCGLPVLLRCPWSPAQNLCLARREGPRSDKVTVILHKWMFAKAGSSLDTVASGRSRLRSGLRQTGGELLAAAFLNCSLGCISFFLKIALHFLLSDFSCTLVHLLWVRCCFLPWKGVQDCSA